MTMGCVLKNSSEKQSSLATASMYQFSPSSSTTVYSSSQTGGRLFASFSALAWNIARSDGLGSGDDPGGACRRFRRRPKGYEGGGVVPTGGISIAAGRSFG